MTHEGTESVSKTNSNVHSSTGGTDMDDISSLQSSVDSTSNDNGVIALQNIEPNSAADSSSLVSRSQSIPSSLASSISRIAALHKHITSNVQQVVSDIYEDNAINTEGEEEKRKTRL